MKKTKKIFKRSLILLVVIASFIIGRYTAPEEVQEIVSFEETETGIQLNYADGTGYYIEKGEFK